MGEDDKRISAGLPGHLIRRLHQISTAVFMRDVKAAGYDLTPVQFAALDALKHHGGIDQAGLATAIAKDRATTGTVIDRLVRKKLISRTVSPSDKRARVLRLTADGEALLAALTPIVLRLQKDILPGLTKTEYDQFVSLAAKAAQAADTG